MFPLSSFKVLFSFQRIQYHRVPCFHVRLQLIVVLYEDLFFVWFWNGVCLHKFLFAYEHYYFDPSGLLNRPK